MGRPKRKRSSLYKAYYDKDRLEDTDEDVPESTKRYRTTQRDADRVQPGGEQEVMPSGDSDQNESFSPQRERENEFHSSDNTPEELSFHDPVMSESSSSSATESQDGANSDESENVSARGLSHEKMVQDDILSDNEESSSENVASNSDYEASHSDVSSSDSEVPSGKGSSNQSIDLMNESSGTESEDARTHEESENTTEEGSNHENMSEFLTLGSDGNNTSSCESTEQISRRRLLHDMIPCGAVPDVVTSDQSDSDCIVADVTESQSSAAESDDESRGDESLDISERVSTHQNMIEDDVLSTNEVASELDLFDNLADDLEESQSSTTESEDLKDDEESENISEQGSNHENMFHNDVLTSNEVFIGLDVGDNSIDESSVNLENEEQADNLQNETEQDIIKGTEGFEKLLSKLNGVYCEDAVFQSTVNANDIIQIVLGLVQRHKWTHQEKEDVMKLINLILGKRLLPDTRYLLDSIFFPKSSMTYVFYCHKCGTLLGKTELLDSKVRTKLCPNQTCKVNNIISDLNRASYFVSFNIESQLSLLFQDPDIRRVLLNPKSLKSKKHDKVIRDIYDGSVYQEFLSHIDVSSNTRYISISMSVDGVALFVSSSCSITPCFIMINELPPVLRMEKLILAGLWFGKKVQIDIFLPPIIENIRELSETGTTLYISETVCWHVKVYLLSLVADSGLRYEIQGIHGHRGEYSCSWCLHKGEELANARKFPFCYPPPPLRTLDQLVEDAIEAMQTKKVVRGVKCLSVVSAAPYFHPIDGMVVDKMHAADEGVAKAFTLSWMGDDGALPWKIPEKHHSKIESRIAQVRSPIVIRKALRKIAKRARYTAREWENWTLFFSVPMLMDILKENLLQHWALFVQASHLLLKSEITEEMLNVANLLLIEFSAKVEILYDRNMMTFNVHLLSHFVENALRHGPQFALNAYAPEAGNQVLKKVVFASNGIPHQICRFISEGHAAKIMQVEKPSDDANIFLEKTRKKSTSSLIKKVGNAELHGSSKPFRNLNNQEKWLANKYKINVNQCVTYNLVKVNGVTYGVHHLSRKLDNSVALLSSDNVLQIKKILFNEVTNDIFIFGVKIECRPSKYCPQRVVRLKKLPLCFLLDVVSVSETLLCVPLSSVKGNFVNMKLSHGHYLSPVPNTFNMV